MAMTLIVLAATMGNKYGGLKQLEGIGPNGETILDFSVYDAVIEVCKLPIDNPAIALCSLSP